MKTNLDLKTVKGQAAKFAKTQGKHSAFIAVMSVLLVYIFVVWKISQLAVAEPSDTATAQIQTTIPKIDQNAIEQIQTLESNNADIHSLFDKARNNPFQE